MKGDNEDDKSNGVGHKEEEKPKMDESPKLLIKGKNGERPKGLEESLMVNSDSNFTLMKYMACSPTMTNNPKKKDLDTISNPRILSKTEKMSFLQPKDVSMKMSLQVPRLPLGTLASKHHQTN